MVLVMPSFTRRQIDNSELGAVITDPDTAASHRASEGYSAQWAIEGYIVVVGDQLVAVLGLVCTRLTSDTSLTVGCIAIPSPGPQHHIAAATALLTGYLKALRP